MKTHLPLIALSALLSLASFAARAELVEIRWSESGRFEHKASIAPAQFAEVCGKLSKGQTVTWSFKAEGPTNFNIHYHEGEKVTYPEKIDGTGAAEGRLLAAVDQDYCWMWSNKSERALRLELTLQR
ncbi:hypothetical protein [Paucibacter sp. M5-1]|uniref:hypothetical protein n=1 Tax=Paucibacter sp. M5-1 TaxID=3015998 RepID=UPI0022B8E519|nr:hypothetical protein [Paucibacter sp. M5-1]MCZ7879962.1 hypothetical protein [Paucibacter sp. M5-1]